MFDCAFGEVSVSLAMERDQRFEAFKKSARSALKVAEWTQKAAYTSMFEVLDKICLVAPLKLLRTTDSTTAADAYH